MEVVYLSLVEELAGWVQVILRQAYEIQFFSYNLKKINFKVYGAKIKVLFRMCELRNQSQDP